MTRFDAVLFDAGGVLVLPDPTVLSPLLTNYGGAVGTPPHRRAHYAAMAHKSREGSTERDWSSYNDAYVASLGIAEDSPVTCRRSARAHPFRSPLALADSRDVDGTRFAGLRRGADGCRVQCQRPDR